MHVIPKIVQLGNEGMILHHQTAWRFVHALIGIGAVMIQYATFICAVVYLVPMKLDEDNVWKDRSGTKSWFWRSGWDGEGGMERWFGRSGWDEDVVWKERVGRKDGLEGVGWMKMWVGRSGLDEDVVWKESVGRKDGLEGVGGTKMWVGRSGLDEDGVWEEWVGQRWV